MALSLRMPVGAAARAVGRGLRAHAIPILTTLVIAAATVGLYASLRAHEERLIEELIDAEGRALTNELTSALERRMLAVLDLARRWEGVPQPDLAAWVCDTDALATADPTYRAFEWRDAKFEPRWSTPLPAQLPGAELDQAFEAERVNGTTGVLQHATGYVSASFPGPGARRLIVVAAPLQRAGETTGAIGAIVRAQELIDAIVKPAARRGFSVAVREGPYHVFGPRVSRISEVAERWRQTIVVRTGDLVWSVDYWPDPELMDKLHSYAPPVALLAGLFGAIAAGVAVSALQARRRGVDPAAGAANGPA